MRPLLSYRTLKNKKPQPKSRFIIRVHLPFLYTLGKRLHPEQKSLSQKILESTTTIVKNNDCIDGFFVVFRARRAMPLQILVSDKSGFGPGSRDRRGMACRAQNTTRFTE